MLVPKSSLLTRICIKILIKGLFVMDSWQYNSKSRYKAVSFCVCFGIKSWCWSKVANDNPIVNGSQLDVNDWNEFAIVSNVECSVTSSFRTLNHTYWKIINITSSKYTSQLTNYLNNRFKSWVFNDMIKAWKSVAKHWV